MEQGSDKETMMPEGVGYGGMGADSATDSTKSSANIQAQRQKTARNPVVKLDRRRQVLTSK